MDEPCKNHLDQALLSLLNGDPAEGGATTPFGDPRLDGFLDSDQADDILSGLADWASPQQARPGLKDKLFSRLQTAVPPSESQARDTQPWKRWQGESSIARALVKAEEGDWEPTAIEGIEAKRLFVDVERARVDMLVRMAPGTTFPPHRHGGPEACMVLEGDLFGDDFSMAPGDFQRAEAGSTHGNQSTRNGCLLFISSSMHDQLIAAH